MRYLWLPLLILAGCPLDGPNAPSGPLRASDYVWTPEGHSRSGSVDSTLDTAVDLGFSKFRELFPEFLSSVNTVVLKPDVFYADGDSCLGFYLDGTDFITVDSSNLKTMSEIIIPHELLHTCIGDHDHHATQYWNRIHIAGVVIFP